MKFVAAFVLLASGLGAEQIHVARFDAFVKRVAARIAAHLPGPTKEYTFKLITDDPSQTHEPLAFIDGSISVPAALLLEAHSEAEFAGMLAHAMAHIAEGHGCRPAALKSSPLVCRGPVGETATSGSAAERRQREQQADADAVKAMAAAGYNPEALIDYIERTQPRLSSRSSSLPARAARVEAMRELISELPRQTYTAGDPLSPLQEEVRRRMPNRPKGRPALKPAP